MPTKQIYLIDDDIDDQEIFISALQELESVLEFKTAENGDEAYIKLKAKELNPDLIFLDLNMPLMNGQAFLKKIKQEDELKHIPIIVLTTSADENTVIEVKELGAKDLIIKQASFSVFTEVLQKTLSTHL